MRSSASSVGQDKTYRFELKDFLEQSIMNDLNIPPDNESWQRRMGRLANQVFFPLILPASTAVFVWFKEWNNPKPVDRNTNGMIYDENELKEIQERERSTLKKKQENSILELDEEHKKQLEMKGQFFESQRKSKAISSGETEVSVVSNFIKTRRDHEKQVSEEEEKEFKSVLGDLKKVREVLYKRQDIYCSYFKSKEERFKQEKWLLDFTRQKKYDKELSLSSGMQRVLQQDTHCGYGYYDNGRKMWDWLAGVELAAQKRKESKVKTRMQQWEEKLE